MENDLAQAERRARRVWVSIIVGLLGLQVITGIFTVMLATGDSSAAIIPNYYQSAVNWDSTRCACKLLLDLKWKISRYVGPVDPDSKRRELRIQVLDSKEHPVENLNISARLFHHARGADIYQMKLQEISPGLYAGQTALSQSGQWKVDLQVEGDHGIAADSSDLWVE